MFAASFDFDTSKNRDYVFALVSDTHFDYSGAYFNDELFHKQMKRIKEKNGMIFFNGDLADYITKNDGRYTRSKDRFSNDAQIDQTVDCMVEHLTPYVNNIAYIGLGNHEVSCIKYNSTNPISILIHRLNALRDPKLPRIIMGGYSGFIQLKFAYKGSNVKRYTIYHHHGRGGNSKGASDFLKMTNSYDADLYWLGHKHNQVIDDSLVRHSINKMGEVVTKYPLCALSAGYKISKKISNKDHYELNWSEENFYQSSPNGFVELNLKVSKDIIPEVITRRH